MEYKNSKRLTLDRFDRLRLFTSLTPVCKTLNYLDNLNKPSYGVSVSTIYVLRYKRREKVKKHNYYNYYFVDKNGNEVFTTIDVNKEPGTGDYFLFVGCIDNHRLTNTLFLINHGHVVLRSSTLISMNVPESVCETAWDSLPSDLTEFIEWQNSFKCRQFSISLSPEIFKFNTDPKSEVEYNKNRETNYAVNHIMKGNENRLIRSAFLLRFLTGMLDPSDMAQKKEIVHTIESGTGAAS